MIDGRKRLRAILLGVALWLVAARAVHYLGSYLDGGSGSLILFAVAIVTSWLTVDLLRFLVRPAPGELVPAMAWGTLSALLLDGLAISFVPDLYAGIGSATQYGAALIMWGAGLGLLFAFVRERRA